MQSASGIRRVPDDDEVGIVGDEVRVEGEPIGHVKDVPTDANPGRSQSSFGLGELGVDDDCVTRFEGGDQRESLCSTCGGQHHVGRHPVHGRQGLATRRGIGVTGPVMLGGDDGVAKPLRRLTHAHVDGQVDQTVGDVTIPVMVEIGLNDLITSALVELRHLAGKPRCLGGLTGPVQVQVGRLNRGPAQPRRISQSPLGAVGAVGHRDVPRRVEVGQRSRRGAVKFVTNDTDGVTCSDAVPHREPLCHGRIHRQHASHLVPVKVTAQIQQPGALGDDRHPGLSVGPYVVRQLRVGFQIGGMHLRKAASQIQSLDAVRKAPIRKGINVDDPEPCRYQHLGGLGVPEGEGPSGEHTHKRRLTEWMALPAGGFQGSGGVPRLDVEVGGSGSQIHDSVKIDVFGNEVPQPGNLGRGVFPFPRWHQTEVARRHKDRLGTRDLTEHRDAQLG